MVSVYLSNGQTKPDILGHWLQLPNDPDEILECPDELLFNSKGEFSILNDCYTNDDIQYTAKGEYMLDGDELILKNLILTSWTRSFFSEEFAGIAVHVSHDTLEIRMHRMTVETEKYIRL